MNKKNMTMMVAVIVFMNINLYIFGLFRTGIIKNHTEKMTKKC